MLSLIQRFCNLLLLGCILILTLATARGEELRLFGRSSVDGYRAELSSEDWSWLRERRVLRLGITTPDYPPLDVLSNQSDYEGITADYAQLLGELLHVRIELRLFEGRKEALQALKEQSIDLLSTANEYDTSEGVVLSLPYATDQPVLAARSGDESAQVPELSGVRLAMAYHYLSEASVRTHYPKARLQLYPSTLAAMGAVAFGQADVYLGDAIATDYLINRSYLNNIRLVNFASINTAPFAFALNRDNTQLLRVVNQALEAIPERERMLILRRWDADRSSIPGNRIQLTRIEQNWIDQHPVVTMAINETALPFTFFDEDGNLRGISADVLERISQRTGIHFEVNRVGTLQEIASHVARGESDLLPAFTSSIENEGKLSLTRPYFTSAFVLVCRTSSGQVTLNDLAGKTLALVRGSYLYEYLRKNFPHIKIVEVAGAAEAMEMVAEDRADATINTLIGARYLISQRYSGKLRITATIGTVPGQAAFATARGSLELITILDKALLSISPSEMADLTRRWNGEVVISESYWARHGALIFKGLVGGGIALGTVLVWVYWLRRQIRSRIQAEQALSDQMEFMRVLVDGTPHPIYVRDRQGRLVSCNTSYLERLNVRREDVIGHNVGDGVLASLDEARNYESIYQRVMSSGEPDVGDRQLTLSKGEVLTIYQWVLPYRSSDGVMEGIICGWIDISERKNLLEAEQEARDAAESANRAKTTFLATMSHEIRTPMNAILGMLELAQKKSDQGIIDRKALEVASNSAHSLLDLIGDILDIARIESGKLTLDPQRANLRTLIESTLGVFEGLARQKRLGLFFDCIGDATVDVQIDPMRFRQVLSNLIGNAIKFTDQGEVRVAYRSEADGDFLAVRVEVIDSGQGISAEDLQRLFAPFSQVGNRQAFPRNSAGLGLVISRTLCEMMGGSLDLSSELGRGTRVVIQLRLPLLDDLKPIAPLVQEEVAENSPSLNVLVVDDYPANRLLLAQQLGYLGHQVQDADDGEQGLHAWRHGEFDVVITDCNMPNLNGYDLAKAIRQQEREERRLPCVIFGFTANAVPEERQRCLDAGMDDCLFKPITLGDVRCQLTGIAPRIKSKSVTSTFDLAYLQQLTLGNREALNSLLKDLMRSIVEDRNRLAEYSSETNSHQLADLAHRIKGGARLARAGSLLETCEHLESVCQMEATHDQRQSAITALRKALDNLAQELEMQLY
ncbi:transporter substrate-binding domain-containing protein [Pseudomonas sp. IT-P258]|uniref:transporter substrate-binding domain-containing protein n=1 Tax=Pseudomonas sp. IT-P258 TaxID=3026447 RepID=UPI0039E1D6A4